MKNLEAINVFAFLFGLAFVILNNYLARVARAFYIRNSGMDYGLWMFRMIPGYVVGDPLAYTEGNRIYFQKGRYDPHSGS